MSYSLKRKAQSLLAQEQGAVRKDWGGKVTVALVYPNTYAVGMSNLGFQTIYAHLNRLPDVVCERVFLPDPEDIAELHRTRRERLLAGVAAPAARFPPRRASRSPTRATTSTSCGCCASAAFPSAPPTAARATPSCSWAASAPSRTPSRWRPSWISWPSGKARSWSGELVAAYREAGGARERLPGRGDRARGRVRAGQVRPRLRRRGTPHWP